MTNQSSSSSRSGGKAGRKYFNLFPRRKKSGIVCGNVHTHPTGALRISTPSAVSSATFFFSFHGLPSAELKLRGCRVMLCPQWWDIQWRGWGSRALPAPHRANEGPGVCWALCSCGLPFNWSNEMQRPPQCGQMTQEETKRGVETSSETLWAARLIFLFFLTVF